MTVHPGKDEVMPVFSYLQVRHNDQLYSILFSIEILSGWIEISGCIAISGCIGISGCISISGCNATTDDLVFLCFFPSLTNDIFCT